MTEGQTRSRFDPPFFFALFAASAIGYMAGSIFSGTTPDRETLPRQVAAECPGEHRLMTIYEGLLNREEQLEKAEQEVVEAGEMMKLYAAWAARFINFLSLQLADCLEREQTSLSCQREQPEEEGWELILPRSEPGEVEL